ncbi:MAG: hypothetical protein M3N56_12815, partial [Actinomycetota bacterium]|nr:hypothetical protein [Actinomycetota bacterium]
EMIRTEDGEVLGRERFIPKEQWWAERPEDARLPVAATRKAIEKALAGKKLGAREQRVVDYMREVAERSFREVPSRAPHLFDVTRPDEDAPFAVAPRGEDERNLVVVHNLSAENLRFTEELGGEIALPSVAISKIDDPIQGFGEISLVARPGLVDPKGKQGARVYNADVYSPRYPSATYTLRPAARARWKQVEEWFAKTYPDPKGESYDLRSVAYGLAMHLDVASRFQRDGIPGLYSDQALQAYYADTVLGEQVTGTDSGEGRARLSKLIAEHEGEFQAFVRKLFEGTVERKLFKGHTPSGNRKHAPYTIENVLREMRKELRSGEPFFYGAGSVRAKVAKRYRSLEGVKKDRHKLVSEKEMAALKDRFNARLAEIAHDATAAYDGKPDFGYTETFWNAVLDSMKRRGALKDYGFDAARMPWTEIRSFLDELRDAPSEYFEAKIDRAVHLSEFAGALMPEDAAADVRAMLERRGLEVETYKRNDQGSRADALKRLAARLEDQGPPVRFAVTSQGGQQGFDLPEDRVFYRRMVDDTHRLVQAERAAPVPVAGGETLEQAISTHPGKKFGEDEKLRRDILEPIKNLLRASKISLDDAGEFLYALAAPQANATLAARHPRKFGHQSRPGSGMTDSDAAAIVQKALASPQATAYRRLQALNQKLVVRRLDALESGYLISPQTRAQWEADWGPDYVPFRTEQDPTQQLGLGRGFTVAGKESKERKGRASRADNPLVFSLVTARTAVERKERNRVGNLLADLVTKNPAPFWRVTADLNTK